MYFAQRLVVLLLVSLTLTHAFAANNAGSPRPHFLVSDRAACRQVNAEAFLRTELFFGLSRQGLPDVTEQEFQSFIDLQVTPRFPDGLTLLSGKGQFKNAAGTVIQEGSKLLILLYPFTKQASDAVEAIRTDYKGMFQQQSVLRIDEPTCVSF
jgi:hypothetical protein